VEGNACGETRFGDLRGWNKCDFDVVWAWNQMHDRFEMRVSQSVRVQCEEIPVTGKDWAGNELL